MNDPNRQRPFDSFDDDAIFADIVAHLNDEARQDGQAPGPGLEDPATTDDAATDVEDAKNDVETGDGSADESAEPTEGQSSDLTSREISSSDPRYWAINPPPGAPRHSDPHVVPGPLVWRAHEVDDQAEAEEHFEPPPVTPLPAGDLSFWAIIIGMSGGPLLLLYLVFFNRDAGSYWILTAIAMSVGGFALLVSRMPGHHEDDDDGARL